jgi:hypothetical protein
LEGGEAVWTYSVRGVEEVGGDWSEALVVAVSAEAEEEVAYNKAVV